jgi:hypothetical protein
LSDELGFGIMNNVGRGAFEAFIGYVDPSIYNCKDNEYEKSVKVSISY